MSISWATSLLHSVVFSLSYVSLFRVDQPRNWVRACTRRQRQNEPVKSFVWIVCKRKKRQIHKLIYKRTEKLEEKNKILKYLCNLFIVLVKGFAVISVVESGNADNFFLFVDNREGQDILDLPPSLVHRIFLSSEYKRIFGSSQCTN